MRIHTSFCMDICTSCPLCLGQLSCLHSVLLSSLFPFHGCIIEAQGPCRFFVPSTFLDDQNGPFCILLDHQ